MTQQEFEITAKELRPLMYDVGLRYFHLQDDAEDVAQESFRNKKTLIPKANLKL